MSGSSEGEDKPEPKRKHTIVTTEDAKRWEALYRQRVSILKIARQEGVDPGTVSNWLRKLGVKVIRGRHFVIQPNPNYSSEAIELFLGGTSGVRALLEEKVWGIQFSSTGLKQLEKFCDFIALLKQGLGVEEISRRLHLHRSSVAEWRNATDQPYLVRTALSLLARPPNPGLLRLPTSIQSGGNNQTGWIEVPAEIQTFDEIIGTVGQLAPLPEARDRAQVLGIKMDDIERVKTEFFAYLLGIMVGDSAKNVGEQVRFVSMNLDLELSKKHLSNERLGEFTSLCANSLGLRMNRIQDKKPSGASRFGRNPSLAFRWTSVRSPLLAWMFSVCLGLKPGETTTTHPVHVEWIFNAPRWFRVRFVQGIADSDGNVKPSEVVITSVPNADLLTRILLGLGMSTAHTIYENGVPLRTMVNRRESSELPIFNEYVRSYRYRRMLDWSSTAPTTE